MTELEMHWHTLVPYVIRDVNTVNLGCGAEQMPRFPFPITGIDTNPALFPPANIIGDCRSEFVCGYIVPTFRQVISSHLLEDYEDWKNVLDQWLTRGLATHHKRRLLLLVPDKHKFRAAVAAGQPDNLAHKHEFTLGELTQAVDALSRHYSGQVKFKVLTESHVGAYGILFVVDSERYYEDSILSE